MLQEECTKRRKKLFGILKKNSIAIIPGATEKIRNGDVTYRFCQDSNFYYLTGFNEPDALLALVKDAEGRTKSILFTREKNPVIEQWTGEILGTKAAKKHLNMDEVFDITHVDKILPEIILDKEFLYFSLGRHLIWEHRLNKIIKTIKETNSRKAAHPDTIIDIDPVIAELRIIKSKFELELMQRAADISVHAHLYTMKNARNKKFEYEIQAQFQYSMLEQGALNYAYEPIVGSGKNATVLHYIDNNQKIPKDSLILLDAGAEWEHYAADITRTFPVNGKFSPEQKAIYELVLEAQQSAIAIIKPGLRIDKIQQTIIKIITKGLVKLRLLEGQVDKLIKEEAYKNFYMHSFGHWLGLDVHDSGAYKVNDKFRELAPGMTLTVEPGIYISSKLSGIHNKWLNIGVRIEDDILVTEKGFKNLTGKLPVSVKDIEAVVCG